MIDVIPSVDLSEGTVVRLSRGGRGSRVVYSDDPLSVAYRFADEGAARLHVVDLDGAMTGNPRNQQVVRAIRSSVPLEIQVGGGIRTIEDADAWFAEGVERVVLGTLALTDAEALFDLADRYPGRIVVALDVDRGQARIEGHAREFLRSISEVLAQIEAAGVTTVLHTDIGRDGTLAGPNFAALRALAALTRMNVMAAGGIASPQDLARLQRLEREGICAAIVGKALYEGHFRLEQGLRAVRSAERDQREEEERAEAEGVR